MCPKQLNSDFMEIACSTSDFKYFSKRILFSHYEFNANLSNQMIKPFRHAFHFIHKVLN